METNVLERFNLWLQESVTIKLFSIGILVLILLIPTSWITSLMEERQQRADEVMNEVGNKWSGPQTLVGPVLVIPYEWEEKIDWGSDGIKIKRHKDLAYFLPETLHIDGKVKPQLLHRGLFDAVVYESSITMQSTFLPPDFTKLQVDEKMIFWKEAQLIFGISDLRGITDLPAITVNGESLSTEPTGRTAIWLPGSRSSDQPSLENSVEEKHTDGGIVTKLNWNSASDFKDKVSLQLSLKGSRQLYFVPVGKNTDVKLSGPWPDPSFDGEFLPVSRTVGENNFEAAWKVLHFNRPFAQQWIGASATPAGNDFGVKLLIPVDQYQKSIRSAKYAALLILLTFVALFMVEIMRKVRIHPFQYILIGVAIIIYYALLLSFSEHVGFNWAYGLACLATVTLISLYATTFLDRKIMSLFSLLLTFFYLFIFVIIQLQDYSLLLGSLGLFLIISLLMYFSRNIRWYGKQVES